MPHFIIEYGNVFTNDHQKEAAMRLAIKCGENSQIMNREDIKVRLQPFIDFLAADGRESFLHITVRLLEGRTNAQKETLSCLLRNRFAEEYNDCESISIDIQDMNAFAYKKRLT